MSLVRDLDGQQQSSSLLLLLSPCSSSVVSLPPPLCGGSDQNVSQTTGDFLVLGLPHCLLDLPRVLLSLLSSTFPSFCAPGAARPEAAAATRATTSAALRY
eukprot:110215-Hanusia_phi.AAC.3